MSKNKLSTAATYNSPLNPNNPKHKSPKHQIPELTEKQSENLAFMNKLSRNDSFSNANVRDSKNLTFRAITNSINKKGFELPLQTIAVDKWLQDDSDSFFSSVDLYSK